MFDKYRSQGFSMVALNTNPDQDGQIAEWREKGKYTFPVVLSPSRDFARTTYGVSGTPTNMILDADGKMVFRLLGYGPGGEKVIEAQVRELLGLDAFGDSRSNPNSNPNPDPNPKRNPDLNPNPNPSPN